MRKSKEQAIIDYVKSRHPEPVTAREVAFNVFHGYGFTAGSAGQIMSKMDTVERFRDTYGYKYRLIPGCQ